MSMSITCSCMNPPRYNREYADLVLSFRTSAPAARHATTPTPPIALLPVTYFDRCAVAYQRNIIAIYTAIY
jgi:hypothetical protein